LRKAGRPAGLCENRRVPGIVDSVALNLRVTKRLAPRRGASLAFITNARRDRTVTPARVMSTSTS